MRFLVDQNLAELVAKRLNGVGHEAQHTKWVGLDRSFDEDVFEWCRQCNSVLLTEDKKLTKYLASQRASDPTVVIFRNYALDFEQLVSDLLKALPGIEAMIATGGSAVYSVAPSKPIKVQFLPLLSDI